jgi:hypothetical protein
MQKVRSLLEAFQSACEAAGSQHLIACLKRALLAQGVIRSAAVALGTPALSAEAARRFDEAFAELRVRSQERIGEPWVTLPPGALGGSRHGSFL